MKNILLAITLVLIAGTATAQEYSFSSLTVESLAELSETEQVVAISAVRDTAVFVFHVTGLHTLDECIANLSDEEMEILHNSVLGAQNKNVAVAAAFTQLAERLCAVKVFGQSQPQRNSQPRVQPQQL